MSATVEINDAVFCQDHLQEVCEECACDLREDNDAFYGFNSIDRASLQCPPVAMNDGYYTCEAHSSGNCSLCFGWKKQILKAQKEAKRKMQAEGKTAIELE
ncbi:hypothetical protein B0T10DRAFT_563067 [Thelonectria olida]|uniref:Uncharacterized protein n=1 Tax=Thelonectria olida TaxID=1576542 RepID=A0A9P8W086_9HYPO|nr:hypothetical protein B0T10DRAFT_563067 [Thelonectria olida]